MRLTVGWGIASVAGVCGVSHALRGALPSMFTETAGSFSGEMARTTLNSRAGAERGDRYRLAQVFLRRGFFGRGNSQVAPIRMQMAAFPYQA